MLILKLTVVPFIIFIVSQATKVWGPYIGGFLSGLPVIAGPITIFLAIEYGTDFAIVSANSTLVGIMALASFCFVYGWCSTRLNWVLSLTISWLIYFMLSFGLSHFQTTPNVAIALVAFTIYALRRLLPNVTATSEKVLISNAQIWARIVSSALLVLLVTGFAAYLGPNLSGIFAAFPLAATILALFTHINYSSDQTIILLNGIMHGILSLGIFYYCLSVSAHWLGFYQAFILSGCAALGFQFFNLKLAR